MLRFLLSLLLIVSVSRIANGQSLTVPDTFYVKGLTFSMTTPHDWFSFSVNDGICQDTAWNYKMRYIPIANPENAVAEIWIRIVDNPKDSSTKKERKEFNRKCTVTQSALDAWPCYRLKYVPEKIKGCKECGRLYTQLYSVPLNKTQSLHILFLGQGKSKGVYPLQISFPEIATSFVKSNRNSLSGFRLIDFSKEMRNDTFHVGKYAVKFPVLPQFTSGPKEKEIGSGGRTLSGTRISNAHEIVSDDFSVSVIGTIRPETDSAIALKATDTIISRVFSQDAYGYGSCIRLNKKCLIKTTSNELIVFSFELKIPSLALDGVWIAYYENILVEYINQFRKSNPTIKEYALYNYKLPSISPEKNPDPFQPKRNDKFQLNLPKPK